VFEEYQEQIALNGTRPGRPESPALEGAASKAIEDAFRELIENSYFYQKITVDLTDMDEAIKHSIEQEKIERGRSIGPPSRTRSDRNNSGTLGTVTWGSPSSSLASRHPSRGR